MKILVACEFSGVVRDAFIKRGFNAISCDLLPTEAEGPHIQADVSLVLDQGFDLMIAHPPCTYLASSGERWKLGNPKRWQQRVDALNFVNTLLNAPIKHIALENPKGVISSHIRKPEQIIQPWQFGHGETKETHLWLKNLPQLTPTNIVEGREPKVHYASPGPDRWKIRSLTYQGIADAMAKQWGDYLKGIAQ